MIQLKTALFFFMALAFLCSPAFASKPELYGKKLSLTEVTNISDILATPEQYAGKQVLVKGMVVEVCAKRGCWMDIASDKAFEKIQIKVLDGQIVFPLSARGKEALLEGVVEALKYTKPISARSWNPAGWLPILR